MVIQNGSKIVFFGDSVTDAGRARPVAEGLFDPFGTGFVQYINALLKSTYVDQDFRVVNMGVSGDTTQSLVERMDEDVINLKPDWLSIMIGINDVWRQFDSELFPEGHVYIDAYEANLRKIIERAKAEIGNLKGIVLCTPYYIEPLKDDKMRNEMDKYGEVVRKLAKEYDTLFVDTQAVFDEYLKHHHSTTLAWDRVHPNNTGHMILARAWLKAVGYEF